MNEQANPAKQGPQPGLFDRPQMIDRAEFALKMKYKKKSARRAILRFFVDYQGTFYSTGQLNEIFCLRGSHDFAGVSWKRRLQELRAEGLVQTCVKPKGNMNLWGIPERIVK